MPRTFQQGDEPVQGYRLVKYLGKGGLGDVWQASGPGGTEVAFKIIQLANKAGDFDLRHVELIKKIKHPNLCPVLALWITGAEKKKPSSSIKKMEVVGAGVGDPSRSTYTLAEMDLDEEMIAAERPHAETLYIAMGLAEKSLLERFKECKEQGQQGIPTAELIGYFEDAARAIDHLNAPKHDLGNGLVAIPHCNIKPQNLLIVGGAVQVCDHGLVRVLGEARTAGHPSASAAFTAPELLDHGKPSMNSDQYSLAITYHFLRTGALPFSMNEANVVLTEALEGRLDLSRLSTAEQQVIRRATSRRPEARFANCQDLARELRRAIERSSSVQNDGLVIEPNREIVPGHKLVKLIGRGAYGEVWEAQAPGRLPIALKIIKDLDRASGRGKQEFRALEIIQNISHNGLMELRAYWLLDRHGQPIPDEMRGHAGSPVPATLIIATKLADMNLTQVLDQFKEQGKKGIPVKELLNYLRQVAVAIDFLNQPSHLLGERRVSIQHRDVKPDNIMIANDTVKLTDFGLAKVMETDSVIAEIRQDSVGFTFHYAAPEVLRGKVTKWSDQYSLAITYFQLRTGMLPYGLDCSAYDQMMRQLEGQLDLKLLPPAERKVMTRATSVIPEERYPTCRAFLEALTIAVPAAGELNDDNYEETQEKSASILLTQSSITARRPSTPADLVPVATPPPAEPRVSRHPKTMQVTLKQGELYPATVRVPRMTQVAPVARETYHEEPPVTKVMPPIVPKPAAPVVTAKAKSPFKEYVLPLSVVFIVGISMAMLVNQVLKRLGDKTIAQTPATEPTDYSPSDGEGRFNSRLTHRSTTTTAPATTVNKQSEIIAAADHRPTAPPTKPPDLLNPPVASSTPVPAPIFVLGKNVADPGFPSFLQSSLDRIIASTSTPAVFSRSFRELDQVPSNAFSSKLLAFRAECMIEGEARDLQQAELYLKQVNDLNLQTAYSQYVQARWYQEMRDPVRAVTSLEQSLQRDISLSGFRRERALSILEEAAQRVSMAVDVKSLTASLAAPLPTWLPTAERYMGKPQPGSSLAMVLAAQNPAGKDPAVIQSLLTAPVIEEWSKKPQGPVVVVSLRLKQAEAATAAKHTEQALGIYADTWNYIKQYRSAFAATSPLIINARIFEPAQKQAAALKPHATRNAQLATILAGYGELVFQAPYEGWPTPANKPALRTAADAYGEALKLNPGTGRIRAEYLVGQAQCLSRLDTLTAADITIIANNATAATAADANYSGSWNILGIARCRQVVMQANETDQRKSLVDAIAAYDQAIRLAEQLNPTDRLLAQYRSNRSLTKSMLGDFTPVDNNQRQFVYQDAIADAVRATDLDASLGSAWGALGQARERLATLVRGVASYTIFSDAVTAYRKQLEASPFQASCSANLGRCLVRWALDDSRELTRLDQGRDELIKAIKLNADLSEAHFWLGRYYQVKDDAGRAQEEFLTAMKYPEALLIIRLWLKTEQPSTGSWQLAFTLGRLLDTTAAKAPAAQAKNQREEAVRALDVALLQAPTDQKEQVLRLKNDIQSKLR